MIKSEWWGISKAPSQYQAFISANLRKALIRWKNAKTLSIFAGNIAVNLVQDNTCSKIYIMPPGCTAEFISTAGHRHAVHCNIL